MSEIVESKINDIDLNPNDGGYCSGASDISDNSDTEDELALEAKKEITLNSALKFSPQIAYCSCCGQIISKPIKNPIGLDNVDNYLEWCPGLSDCLLTILELKTLTYNIINYKDKDANKKLDTFYKKERKDNNLSNICEDNNYREISSYLLYIIRLDNNKYFSTINEDTLALKIITSWFIGNKDRIFSLGLLLRYINDNLY